MKLTRRKSLGELLTAMNLIFVTENLKKKNVKEKRGTASGLKKI